MSVLTAVKDKALLAFVSELETAVVKATNADVVAPKLKHVKYLLNASHDRDVAMSDFFKLMQLRLKEGSWVAAFKTLIVIHYLLREGSERVIGYLCTEPRVLNMSSFKDKSSSQAVEQSRNIFSYATYLEEKVYVFRELKYDYIREKGEIGRLRRMDLKRGLLREIVILQRQLKTLLLCKFYLDEIDNPVTLEALRLLVLDLIKLFQAVNEGVINILENYFDMSKDDATESLSIYKEFAKQTEEVTAFLDIARKLSSELGMDVPVFKHAPTSLSVSLEEYLKELKPKVDYENDREVERISFESFEKPQVVTSSSRRTISNANEYTAVRNSIRNEMTAAAAKAVVGSPTQDLFGDFHTAVSDSNLAQSSTTGFGDSFSNLAARTTAAAQPTPAQADPFFAPTVPASGSIANRNPAVSNQSLSGGGNSQINQGQANFGGASSSSNVDLFSFQEIDSKRRNYTEKKLEIEKLYQQPYTPPTSFNPFAQTAVPAYGAGPANYPAPMSNPLVASRTGSFPNLQAGVPNSMQQQRPPFGFDAMYQQQQPYGGVAMSNNVNRQMSVMGNGGSMYGNSMQAGFGASGPAAAAGPAAAGAGAGWANNSGFAAAASTNPFGQPASGFPPSVSSTNPFAASSSPQLQRAATNPAGFGSNPFFANNGASTAYVGVPPYQQQQQQQQQQGGFGSAAAFNQGESLI